LATLAAKTTPPTIATGITHAGLASTLVGTAAAASAVNPAIVNAVIVLNCQLLSWIGSAKRLNVTQPLSLFAQAN
jgi:hypothetical protein